MMPALALTQVLPLDALALLADLALLAGLTLPAGSFSLTPDGAGATAGRRRGRSGRRPGTAWRREDLVGAVRGAGEVDRDHPVVVGRAGGEAGDGLSDRFTVDATADRVGDQRARPIAG